jgi:hypothetical protein
MYVPDQRVRHHRFDRKIFVMSMKVKYAMMKGMRTELMIKLIRFQIAKLIEIINKLQI